jgi:long-chain acyl-CoA synthetase
MTATPALSGHRSVGEAILTRCRSTPEAEAFRHPAAGDQWASLTWGEVAARTTELAAGLLALGVTSEQRVAIAATTRIEWVLADLAVMFAGAATTTVYPTTNTDDVTYILADCAAVLVFAEDAAQVAKLRSGDGWVAGVRHVVVFDAVDDPAVLTLDDLATLGRRHLEGNPGAVDDALGAVRPDQLATIIYTSGTTGRPKGVELTHANWIYMGAAVGGEDLMRPHDVQFLWLPLSHVFGKLLLATQYEVGFVTAIDGRIDRIVPNLTIVQPTIMAAAPRIFEKVHSRIVAAATDGGGPRAALFRWAFRIGIDAVHRRQQGLPVPPLRRAQLALADRLVFAPIRSRLGGRLEILFSGSAALSPAIAEWFAAAGLPILEGYGLTEATGVSFCNRPGRLHIGTVGQPLPGTEVRIGEDGEILLRGPGVMRGYHCLPDQTTAAIDAEGWLATGDVGEIDADGYLRITDRKKDLAKTSGGKYIAPTAIESALKAASPLIGTAVVIADGRNFASALLTLDPDTTRGLPADAINAGISRAIDTVNAGLNRWETVKQFRVLPRELTVEAGELTPSLKVKRAVVARHYADLIDSIYGSTQ